MVHAARGVRARAAAAGRPRARGEIELRLTRAVLAGGREGVLQEALLPMNANTLLSNGTEIRTIPRCENAGACRWPYIYMVCVVRRVGTARLHVCVLMCLRIESRFVCMPRVHRRNVHWLRSA